MSIIRPNTHDGVIVGFKSIKIAFDYLPVPKFREIYRIFKLYRGRRYKGNTIMKATCWFGFNNYNTGFGNNNIALTTLADIIFKLEGVVEPNYLARADQDVEALSNAKARESLLELEELLSSSAFYNKQTGQVTFQDNTTIKDLFVHFTFHFANEFTNEHLFDAQTIRYHDASVRNYSLDALRRMPDDEATYYQHLSDIADELYAEHLNREHNAYHVADNGEYDDEYDDEADIIQHLQNTTTARTKHNIAKKGLGLIRRIKRLP